MRQPLRVILAGVQPLPGQAQLFQDDTARTLVVTTEAYYQTHRPILIHCSGQVELICVPEANGYPDPTALLQVLYEREIVGLLLEGGPKVAAAFLDAGLIDRVSAFLAPKLIGPNGIPAFCHRDATRLEEALGLQAVESMTVGQDILVTGRLFLK